MYWGMFVKCGMHMYKMVESSACGSNEYVEQLTVSALPTLNEGESILSLTLTESLLDKLGVPKPSEISRKRVIHYNSPQSKWSSKFSGQFDPKSVESSSVNTCTLVFPWKSCFVRHTRRNLVGRPMC